METVVDSELKDHIITGKHKVEKSIFGLECEDAKSRNITPAELMVEVSEIQLLGASISQ